MIRASATALTSVWRGVGTWWTQAPRTTRQLLTLLSLTAAAAATGYLVATHGVAAVVAVGVDGIVVVALGGFVLLRTGQWISGRGARRAQAAQSETSRLRAPRTWAAITLGFGDAIGGVYGLLPDQTAEHMATLWGVTPQLIVWMSTASLVTTGVVLVLAHSSRAKTWTWQTVSVWSVVLAGTLVALAIAPNYPVALTLFVLGSIFDGMTGFAQEKAQARYNLDDKEAARFTSQLFFWWSLFMAGLPLGFTALVSTVSAHAGHQAGFSCGMLALGALMTVEAAMLTWVLRPERIHTIPQPGTSLRQRAHIHAAQLRQRTRRLTAHLRQRAHTHGSQPGTQERPHAPSPRQRARALGSQLRNKLGNEAFAFPFLAAIPMDGLPLGAISAMALSHGGTLLTVGLLVAAFRFAQAPFSRMWNQIAVRWEYTGQLPTYALLIGLGSVATGAVLPSHTPGLLGYLELLAVFLPSALASIAARNMAAGLAKKQGHGGISLFFLGRTLGVALPLPVGHLLFHHWGMPGLITGITIAYLGYAIYIRRRDTTRPTPTDTIATGTLTPPGHHPGIANNPDLTTYTDPTRL